MTSAPAAGTAPPRARASAGTALAEGEAIERFARLKHLVAMEAWAMAALALILALLLPFAQPAYLYYAREPDGKAMQMAGLDMPNMTNRAVLAWATTSITEIMTMGFGDMDARLPQQRSRFTEAGWEAYVKAFVNQKIGETFKKSQLVLTTVPSNTPVVVNQGVNLDMVYQWTVQMPVIMTYATNNNVTEKQRAVVTLTIVRVPAEESSAGIAIQNWVLE